MATCGAGVLGLAHFSPLALRAEHGLTVSALLDKFWTLIDPTLPLTSEDTETPKSIVGFNDLEIIISLILFFNLMLSFACCKD